MSVALIPESKRPTAVNSYTAPLPFVYNPSIDKFTQSAPELLMPTVPIALQLYTIRDYVAKDFTAAVAKVAEIGYRYVELVDFGNLTSAAQAREALDAAGLKVAGAHVPIDRWSDLNAVFDEADTVGNENLVVPWIDPAMRTVDGYRSLAHLLSKASVSAKARSKRVAYHNHDFELQHPAGQPSSAESHTGLDLLWSNTDPDSVFAELDLFWLKVAGVDPLAYMRRLGGRTLLIHLKDQSKTNPRDFAAVGTGTLDFPAIMNTAASLGVKYAIVEQDDCYGQDSLQLARTCFQNLQKMGLT